MIKKEWAGKGEIDLISVKKIIIWLLATLSSFYLLNIDIINNYLSQYITDPQLLSIVVAGLLYVSEEFRKNYSK